MPIAPGTKLGSYVVQDFLGQGAMGVVYRAYHAHLERPAAVKILQGLAPDADSVARFRREAQSIGRMRHPNVLNVFDYGEFEGSPYMIVEFVEGGSLAGRLTQAPMDREDALRYLAGIGEALDYAHSLGVVHRDVKPANVLIGTHDAPILADFGLAKLLQSSSVKSMTGVTTGTPAYMAPEQVTGSQVGPAADRYSLAVMAYEMLTGSLPFSGENVLEVLYAHVHREPQPPSKLNPSLPAKVDEVVLRGMAKDPVARWETCESFVTALRSSLGDTAAAAIPATGGSTVHMAPPIPATAEVAAETSPAAAVAAPVVPAAATMVVAPPRKRSRRPLLFAIGAAVLVVALIVTAVAVYGATRPTTLAVTPGIVRAGDHVVVSAHHVPRNQAGELELAGTEHIAPFRASANGDVSQEFAVPRDTAPGGYIVRICWAGACHASADVTVIAPVAFVTPGTSPSPGVTPSPSPTHSAASSPTPHSSPTSASTPRIAVTPSAAILPGQSVTVTGTNFVPHVSVTLAFRQSGQPDKSLNPASSGPAGNFTKVVVIPSTAKLGAATLIACEPTGCTSAAIGIA